MRRVFDFVLTVPDTCSRLTYHELLLAATFLTLVLWVILSMSGRKLA